MGKNRARYRELNDKVILLCKSRFFFYGTRRTVVLLQIKCFVLVPERMQTYSCHAFVMHDMSHIGYWHFLEK